MNSSDFNVAKDETQCNSLLQKLIFILTKFNFKVVTSHRKK